MKISTSFHEASKLTDYFPAHWISPLTLVFYLVSLGTNIVLCTSSSTLPSFRNTPSNYTYPEGELAVLYCSIQNLGTRTVTWRRTRQPSPVTIGLLTYDPDDRYKVHYVKEKEEWNLFIKNLKHEDAGMYECQISSKERYIRKLIQLNVIDRPYRPREIHINGPRKIAKDSDIFLACNATGGKTVPHDLNWIKDDKRLISNKSGRIHITKHISYVTMTIVSNLTIKAAKKDDGGTYFCRTFGDLVKNVTIEVFAGGSENVKRTISQDVPAPSSSATSVPSASTKTVIIILVTFLLHCQLTLELFSFAFFRANILNFAFFDD